MDEEKYEKLILALQLGCVRDNVSIKLDKTISNFILRVMKDNYKEDKSIVFNFCDNVDIDNIKPLKDRIMANIEKGKEALEKEKI